MDDAHDGPYAREPQIEDLVRICRALNEAGARYVLIGGFAVIAHGGARTTKDIDLLVDASSENVTRIKPPESSNIARSTRSPRRISRAIQ